MPDEEQRGGSSNGEAPKESEGPEEGKSKEPEGKQAAGSEKTPDPGAARERAIAGKPSEESEEEVGEKPEATGETADKGEAVSEPPAGELKESEEPATEEKAEKPAAEAKPAAEEKKAEKPAAEKPTAEKQPAAKKEEEEPARKPPPPGSVADLLKEALPDLEFEAYQTVTDVVVEIKPHDVPNVMPVAKDDPRLDLKFLRCLFAVDYEDEGMDVVYQLGSLEKGHDVVIKTRLPKDGLKIASASEIWRAADWHERETRDMFGIEFEGHAHLVPLLLPEDMTDHFPLRKENALAEIDEWQADLVEESEGVKGGKG